jgi:hypothetical protein
MLDTAQGQDHKQHNTKYNGVEEKEKEEEEKEEEEEEEEDMSIDPFWWRKSAGDPKEYPPPALVNEIHAYYYRAVSKLFEEHKQRAGFPNMKLVFADH